MKDYRVQKEEEWKMREGERERGLPRLGSVEHWVERRNLYTLRSASSRTSVLLSSLYFQAKIYE
jgi:hypothetical protein